MRAKLPPTLKRPSLRPRPPFHPLPLSLPLPSLHPFTTHPPLSARGGKQESKRTVPHNAQKTAGQDPFDLSDYEEAVARAKGRLGEELKRVKAGGMDMEGVEGVRVLVGRGSEKADGNGRGKGEGKGKGKGESMRLGDLASVVKRGRNLAVLVGEKDHIKPITSALSSSPHNLNPTPSPSDPLTLMIPIPPTTAESRREAQGVAGKRGEEALGALREARGGQRKRLRGLGLGKLVGPDDLRRAEAALEKGNERAVEEVKKMVEGWRKGLKG